jgi:hypothetical protein
MQILEDLPGWAAEFEANWLAHYQQTGETNFKVYNRPRNAMAPAGPGIDLGQSRLALISTAGGYLPASQEPFDAENLLGDYAIRLFPTATPLHDIAYAHTHYDHAAVNEDPQVLLPLRHLEAMVDAGKIGELAPSVINFMGYQPDVQRVIDQMIPAIIDVAKAEQIDAALLVPA